MRLHRNNSLRNKLILFLLVSIVIPISLSIAISYAYTKDSFRKESIQNNTKLLYQGSSNLLHYLDRLNQTSLLIYSNPSAPNSLYNIIEKGSNDYTDDREIIRNLLFIYNTIEEIHSIYLYSDTQAKSFRIANRLSEKMQGRTYNPQYSAKETVRIEPVHVSHGYGFANPFDVPEKVITIHRKILHAPHSDLLGSVSIDIKTDVIDQISSMLFNEGQEQFYILDRTGGIIYSSEPYEQSSLIQNDWVTDILARPGESGNYKYENDRFQGIQFYQKVANAYADWIIVKRVPFSQLYRNATDSALISSLINALFLVIVVAATIYVSLWFTKPIKQLIRYIGRIEMGQAETDLPIQRSDEIGVLSNRFHQMMEKINDLVLQEYRLELSNKTQQLKTLQAQVNPHFLYNALQSIATLSLQNNDKRVYMLISSLGKMMRYSMNTQEEIVPLHREIEHVKSYLALQQQRFDGEIKYLWDIEEGALSVPMPKMIVQPLVENYFKHGFVRSPQHENQLGIACRLRSEGSVEIEVADNGIGMEPDKLMDMQAQLNQPLRLFQNEPSAHIGLMNVLSRLQLNMSTESRIILAANRPQGLKVTLQIPHMEGDRAL